LIVVEIGIDKVFFFFFLIDLFFVKIILERKARRECISPLDIACLKTNYFLKK